MPHAWTKTGWKKSAPQLDVYRSLLEREKAEAAALTIPKYAPPAEKDVERQCKQAGIVFKPRDSRQFPPQAPEPVFRRSVIASMVSGERPFQYQKPPENMELRKMNTAALLPQWPPPRLETSASSSAGFGSVQKSASTGALTGRSTASSSAAGTAAAVAGKPKMDERHLALLNKTKEGFLNELEWQVGTPPRRPFELHAPFANRSYETALFMGPHGSPTPRAFAP
eukprot:TRINITY_DN86774_c0_g1_i1.p1 TRINITY_DN86774_c0_g1~~TRINITY_DN86774_c0_g1_i1.p1  ORF type:complete len:225 (-),score=39.21 TRINITY_DN86774_c0_g1_i1:106-780(-)